MTAFRTSADFKRWERRMRKLKLLELFETIAVKHGTTTFQMFTRRTTAATRARVECWVYQRTKQGLSATEIADLWFRDASTLSYALKKAGVVDG